MALHSTTSRIINILELLSSSEEGYTLTEISKLLNIPKTSLSPILKTLNYYNYLSCDEITFKYSVDIGILSIASSVKKDRAVVKFIRSEMEKIVSECNEICQLGVLQGNEVLYLEKVDSSNAIELKSFVGVKLPANATALGKALLFNSSLANLKKIFPNKLKKMTDNTITSINELHKNLLKVKENGYASETEEGMKDVKCLAIPIRKDGDAIASISVSVPLFRSSDKKDEQIVVLLKAAQKRIENYIVNMDISSILD